MQKLSIKILPVKPVDLDCQVGPRFITRLRTLLLIGDMILMLKPTVAV